MDSLTHTIIAVGSLAGFFYAGVFITKWKIKNMRCGYSFSPVGTTYEAGSIVFIRVPLNTNQTYMFNPKYGKENYFNT